MRKFKYHINSFKNLIELADFLNKKQISIENIVQIILDSSKLYPYRILYLEKIGE